MSKTRVKNRLSLHFLFHCAPKNIPIMKPITCEIFATFPPVLFVIAMMLKNKYKSAIGPIGDKNWAEYPGRRTSKSADMTENIAADAPTIFAPG